MATDTVIQKKIFGPGMHPLDLAKWTTLIISIEEMKDIMKIVKSFDESSLLIKGVKQKKTIENEAKKQKGGFLSMLAGTSAPSLLRNMSAGKGVI